MIWETVYNSHGEKSYILGEDFEHIKYRIQAEKSVGSQEFTPYVVKTDASPRFASLEEAKAFCEGQMKIRRYKPSPETLLKVSEKTTDFIVEALKDAKLDRASIFHTVHSFYGTYINPEYAVHCLEHIFRTPILESLKNDSAKTETN